MAGLEVQGVLELLLACLCVDQHSRGPGPSAGSQGGVGSWPLWGTVGSQNDVGSLNLKAAGLLVGGAVFPPGS